MAMTTATKAITTFSTTAATNTGTATLND